MENKTEEILNKRSGRVSDFLELTLSDGIVIDNITDMELLTVVADENKDDIYNVEIVTNRTTFNIILDSENYFLLLDDLEEVKYLTLVKCLTLGL